MFLNSTLKILYHRWSHLTELPWQLPKKQPQEDRDNPSGAGIDPLITIHCIWHWPPSIRRLLLGPPDNHRRWRDNLDGEVLWRHPSSRHKKQKQRCQAGVQYWRLGWWKLWLECQLECSDTRWVSTICLDNLVSFFQFFVPHHNDRQCTSISDLIPLSSFLFHIAFC